MELTISGEPKEIASLVAKRLVELSGDGVMGEVCMRGWLYRLSEAAHAAGKWPDGNIPLTEEEARQLYRLWEEFDGSMAEFVEAYL